MIVCSPSGGIGNQLFQIFTTITYSIKLNRKCLFLYDDISRGCGNRKTYWNDFLKSIKHLTIKPLPVVSKIITDDDIYINNKDDVFYDTILLNGYFQNYTYFDKYKDTLCKFIRLEESIKKMITYDNNFETTISLHFRIGDYVKYPNIYQILPYEYYYKSIYFILNKQQTSMPTHILYFCEEIEADLEKIKETIIRLQQDFPDLIFEKASETLEDWQQLILMSCCKYNIIANSTFSWWGAYFNNFENKIVCYPSPWFVKKNMYGALVPLNWNKMEYSGCKQCVNI